ncbi:MAG: hypothetical protein LWY06_02655, partial [Firmicutes bacterium]|nr:hypothetical protein [Bacillota bacterium]
MNFFVNSVAFPLWQEKEMIMLHSIYIMEKIEVIDCNRPFNIQNNNYNKKKGSSVVVPCRILPHELFIYENYGMVDIRYSEDNGLAIISTLTGISVFLKVLKSITIRAGDEEIIDSEEVTIGQKQINVFFETLGFMVGLITMPKREKTYEKYISFPKDEKYPR